MSGTPGGGLSRPGFGERRNLHSERLGIICIGIDVIADPVCKFGVAIVLRIFDCVDQLPATADPAERRSTPIVRYVQCSVTWRVHTEGYHDHA